MKNTIKVIIPLVLIFNFFSKKSLALIPNINIPTMSSVVTVAPTATPTPIVFKKIDPNLIKIITTVTPSPVTVVITQVVTPTIEEEKYLIDSGPSPTVFQEENEETSEVAIKSEEKAEEKVDLKMWFMNITLGLLVLIIVIQTWPKKKIS